MRHGGFARNEGEGEAAPGVVRGRFGPVREQRTTAEQRQQIKAWFTGSPARRLVRRNTAGHGGRRRDPRGRNPAGPDPGQGHFGRGEAHRRAGARGSALREDTREERMRIADEAQGAFSRHVSWGASVGETHEQFTTASVPVMTRLRIDERQILDTLIDAGVARSRSEALAWCVRLVGDNEASWIADLRSAFEQVERVRAQGPTSDSGAGTEDAGSAS